jgi:transcriptional regulator with XRE-family HTH domain
MCDPASVAELLRTRRRTLQPEDVGLPRGPRRRTPGLRREEVAALSSISVAHYTRLESHRGGRPSQAALAGIARSLRLTRADRDVLFGAAGYDPATRALGTAHVDPATMLLLTRMPDTPVLAVDDVGGLLYQTPSARALFGDSTACTGWRRSGYFRWFSSPGERMRYVAAEHADISAQIIAHLREAVTRHGAAAELVRLLLDRSDEFADLWTGQPPVLPAGSLRRRVIHRELGVIELQREVFVENDFRLLVFVPAVGSGAGAAVRLASVLGHHRFGD